MRLNLSIVLALCLCGSAVSHTSPANKREGPKNSRRSIFSSDDDEEDELYIPDIPEIKNRPIGIPPKPKESGSQRSSNRSGGSDDILNFLNEREKRDVRRQSDPRSTGRGRRSSGSGSRSHHSSTSGSGSHSDHSSTSGSGSHSSHSCRGSKCKSRSNASSSGSIKISDLEKLVNAVVNVKAAEPVNVNPPCYGGCNVQPSYAEPAPQPPTYATESQQPAYPQPAYYLQGAPPPSTTYVQPVVYQPVAYPPPPGPGVQAPTYIQNNGYRATVGSQTADASRSQGSTRSTNSGSSSGSSTSGHSASHSRSQSSNGSCLACNGVGSQTADASRSQGSTRSTNSGSSSGHSASHSRSQPSNGSCSACTGGHPK